MTGRAERPIGFVAYVSVLAFGGALVVSLSTVFIPRYTIPIDPLIIIAACLGIWLTLTTLLRPGNAAYAVLDKRLTHADAAPGLGGRA